MAELDLSTALIIQNALLLLMTGAIAACWRACSGWWRIVIVPVLFHLFGVLELPESTAMHVAVGTSLAIIVPTSLSSMRAHFKKGSIDKAVLRRWAGPMFVGSAIGALISAYVSGMVLSTVFAVIAILVAANMATPNGVRVGDSLPSSTRRQCQPVGCDRHLLRHDGDWRGHASGPDLQRLQLRSTWPSAPSPPWGSPSPYRVPPGSSCRAGCAGPAAAEHRLRQSGRLRADLSDDGVDGTVGLLIAHKLNRVWLRRAFALFLAVTAARMFWRLAT